MIHSINGEYQIDGLSCKRIVEEALRRGWAKKARIVEVEEVIPSVIPMVTPAPTLKGIPVSMLEAKAKAAGMSVGEFVDMRMRARSRVEDRKEKEGAD